MRIIFFFLFSFLLASTKLLSQDTYGPEERLHNTKTKAHVKMVRTNVYLLPPDDRFGTSANGRELVDYVSASRIFVHQSIPDNKPPYVSKEDTLIEQHKIWINQYEGTYKTYRTSKYSSREILQFGNANVSVVVSAQIVTNDSIALKRIRKAMRSVVLTDESIPDPADDASFKLDVSAAHLKFSQYINGVLIFTPSGSAYSPDLSFIAQFVYQKTASPEQQEADLKKYLREALYYKNINLFQSSPVLIDGISGYEITAEGILEGKPEGIYLVGLYGKEGCYILLGTAHENYEHHFRLFRQVAHTFYVKPVADH